MSDRLVATARSHPGLAMGIVLAATIGCVALFPGLFTGRSPLAIDMAQALQPPSAGHWFGTDHVGRDVYARVVYGARTTLGVVSGSLLLSAFIGGVAGTVAGYLRGWSDLSSSQLIEVIISFPPIFLGVMITGILGSSLPNLVLALAIVYLPLFFRAARAAAMVEAAKPYVEAAQVLGAGDARVVLRHVLPNVLPAIMTQYVILFPLALQIQAALGFLGLGVQPPTADWGASLQESKDYVLYAGWTAIFPGLALIVSSLAVILVGRGLQARK
jgi:ABC-type dipeptide/oligopeptide/nickel transport system permease subunit